MTRKKIAKHYYGIKNIRFPKIGPYTFQFYRRKDRGYTVQVYENYTSKISLHFPCETNLNTIKEFLRNYKLICKLVKNPEELEKFIEDLQENLEYWKKFELKLENIENDKNE